MINNNKDIKNGAKDEALDWLADASGNIKETYKVVGETLHCVRRKNKSIDMTK